MLRSIFQKEEINSTFLNLKGKNKGEVIENQMRTARTAIYCMQVRQK